MSSRYPDDRRERAAYPSDYYPSSTRGGGVIPISTQTYVNGVPVSSRSTYSEARQAFGMIPSDSPERRASTTSGSGRSRAVVHNERPVSPVIRTSRYKYDTYAEPSSSGRVESRAAYSGEGTRGGRGGDDRDYGRKNYHLSGPSRTSGDDYDRHGRGDARSLYVDTEVRPRRRESIDTGSGRRSSIDGFGIVVPSTVGRAGGPPPATRGLDKLNTGISRTSSTRDKPRSTRHRERGYSSFSDDDNESVMSAKLMPSSSHNPLFYERGTMSPSRDDFDDEPVRRTKYEDSDVASRGFGIRGGSNGVGYLRESGRDAVPHLDPGAGAVPYPRTSNVDLRSDYASDPSGYARDDHRTEVARSERRKDIDTRDRDYEKGRDYERRRTKDRDSDYDDESRFSTRKDRDMDRYDDDDRRSRGKRSTKSEYSERHDRDKDRDRDRHDEGLGGVLTALAGGAAAFGAKEVLGRSKGKDKEPDRDERDRRDKARDRERERVDRPERDRVDRPEKEDREKRERARDIDSDRERDTDRPKKRDAEREREREREAARIEKERLGDLNNRNPQERAPPTRVTDPEVQQRDIPVDLNSRNPREKSAPPRAADVPRDIREPPERRPQQIDEDLPRQRHYVTREDSFRADPPEAQASAAALDPDEEYRRRLEKVQMELERSKHAKPEDSIDSALGEERPRGDYADRPLEERPRTLDTDVRRPPEPIGPPPAINPAEARAMAILGDNTLTEEPSDLEGSSGSASGDRRVRIVEPSKDNTSPQPQLKGILRRPTDKFPEHPNHVREGALPLKEVAEKKGVPAGARWTKIDRRLVNPDALIEAQERFEERADSVIVLRVLTKEEIQKFADRTRELRDERYEQRHKRRDHDGADDEEGREDGGKEKPKQIAFDG